MFRRKMLREIERCSSYSTLLRVSLSPLFSIQNSALEFARDRAKPSPPAAPPSRGGPPLVAHGGDALALGALGAVRLHLAVALRVEVARAGLALLRRARLEGEDDRRGAVVPAGLAHVAARRAVLGGRTRTRQLARSAGGRLGDGGRTRQSSVMCLV